MSYFRMTVFFELPQSRNTQTWSSGSSPWYDRFTSALELRLMYQYYTFERLLHCTQDCIGSKLGSETSLDSTAQVVLSGLRDQETPKGAGAPSNFLRWSESFKTWPVSCRGSAQFVPRQYAACSTFSPSTALRNLDLGSFWTIRTTRNFTQQQHLTIFHQISPYFTKIWGISGLCWSEAKANGRGLSQASQSGPRHSRTPRSRGALVVR